MDAVAFPDGDPGNPRNWPPWRKWSIVAVIVPIDLTVSWAASGFSPASTDFAQDFGVSAETATLGLSLYVLGLAFGPMSLAPLSEYLGRSVIYIASYGIFLIFLLATALVRNLGGFLALRLLSGLFSSVTIGESNLRAASLSACRLLTDNDALQPTLAAPLRICGRIRRRACPCRSFCGLQLVALRPATFSCPLLLRREDGAPFSGLCWESAADFGC